MRCNESQNSTLEASLGAIFEQSDSGKYHAILRPPLKLVLGELFGQWQMPPRKRKVPEPLAISFEAPIGGVVAVRGGGVGYDLG